MTRHQFTKVILPKKCTSRVFVKILRSICKYFMIYIGQTILPSDAASTAHDLQSISRLLKGLSVIINSKIHFFQTPYFFFFISFYLFINLFCIFRENFTVITYLYNNLSETAYFWNERQFFVVGN